MSHQVSCGARDIHQGGAVGDGEGGGSAMEERSSVR